MITNNQIRNALTGALAVMALGLFASCTESLVAPDQYGLEPAGVSASTEQEDLQFCTLVDGVWTCGGPTASTLDGGTTAGDGEDHCEVIMGVLHCPPDGES